MFSHWSARCRVNRMRFSNTGLARRPKCFAAYQIGNMGKSRRTDTRMKTDWNKWVYKTKDRIRSVIGLAEDRKYTNWNILGCSLVIFFFFFFFVNKIGHTFSRPTCDLIDISRALWRHVSLPVYEMKYVFGSDKEFQKLCNKILNLLIIFSMVGCHRYITVNYKVNELSSGRNRGKSVHHMGFITSFSMMKS